MSPVTVTTPVADCLRSQRFSAGTLRSQLACRTTLRSQAHPCCQRST